MKIDVLCRRELNFQGSGGSKNEGISKRFWEGVQSAFWEALFGILMNFGIPGGIPRGAILGQKVIFFEV